MFRTLKIEKQNYRKEWAMKKMLLIIIVLTIANTSILYAKSLEIIDYRNGEIKIDTSSIINGNFPDAKNLVIIKNNYGIFAYINFTGDFTNTENINTKVIIQNKYRKFVNDDFIKKITVSKFSKEEIRISLKLSIENNFYYSYDEKSKEIHIIRENNSQEKNMVVVAKTEKQETKLITPLKHDKLISTISKIDWESNKNKLTLVFDKKIMAKEKLVRDGFDNLVVFDLPNCFYPKTSLTIKTTNNEWIKKIRVQQFNPKTVRIVFYVYNKEAFFSIDRNENCILFSLDDFLTITKIENQAQSIQPITTIAKITKPTEMPKTLPTKTKDSEKDNSSELSANSISASSSIIFNEIDDVFAETPQEDESNFSLGGKIEFNFRTDLKEDNKFEKNKNVDGSIILKTDYHPKKSNLKATASIKADINSQNPDDKFEADIHESYFSYKTDLNNLKLDFLAGKKILRFGKTDEISPVNNLNAEDYREFITKEYLDRLIPAWMIDAKLSSGTWAFELVYLPFFEKAKVNQFGTDWSPFQYFKEEIKDKNPLLYDNFVKNIQVEENLPDSEFLNGEFGLRYSKTFNTIDTEWIYSYTYEDLPYYVQIPKILKGEIPSSTENFILDYSNRYHLFGFAVESNFTDIGVRAEAAWISNKSFLKNDFEPYRSRVFHYILGADYSVNDIYFNFQFSHQINIDYQDNTMFANKHDMQVLGKLSYGNVYGNSLGKKYEIGTQYSLGISDNGDYLGPFAKYYFGNGITAGINLDIFLGKNDTLMGSYSHGKQASFEISYNF